VLDDGKSRDVIKRLRIPKWSGRSKFFQQGNKAIQKLNRWSPLWRHPISQVGIHWVRVLAGMISHSSMSAGPRRSGDGLDQFVECLSANPTIFGDCQIGCRHRFDLVLCSHHANDCKGGIHCDLIGASWTKNRSPANGQRSHFLNRLASHERIEANWRRQAGIDILLRRSAYIEALLPRSSMLIAIARARGLWCVFSPF
jgi:hypothetical protein